LDDDETAVAAVLIFRGRVYTLVTDFVP